MILRKFYLLTLLATTALGANYDLDDSPEDTDDSPTVAPADLPPMAENSVTPVNAAEIFETECLPIIKEATPGDWKTRLAAAEKLKKYLDDSKYSSTLQCRVAVACVDLLRDKELHPEFVTACGAAISILARSSDAAIKIQITAHEAGSKEFHYTPEAITKSYIRRSLAQRTAGDSDDALKSLDEAEKWAAKDPDWQRESRESFAFYRRVLKQHIDDDTLIKQSPPDQAAVNRRAVELLIGRHPEDAADLLCTSEQPRLKQLGETMLKQEANELKHALDIAAATADCVAHVPPSARRDLERIVEENVAAVKQSPKATPLDIDRAELFLDKARKDRERLAQTRPAADDLILPAQAVEAVLFNTPIANRTVILVDHSGSLIDFLDFIRDDLKKRVADLKESESFSMVCYAEWPDMVFPEGGKPTKVDAGVQKKFEATLEKLRAGGKNDDLFDPHADAFECALSMRPSTIVFYSDGSFDPRLADHIARLSASRHVKINTVAYGRSNSGQQLLETISKDSGGTFKAFLTTGSDK